MHTLTEEQLDELEAQATYYHPEPRGGIHVAYALLLPLLLEVYEGRRVVEMSRHDRASFLMAVSVECTECGGAALLCKHYCPDS